MSQEQAVIALTRHAALTKREAEDVIVTLIEVIKEQLRAGQPVELPGLGTLRPHLSRGAWGKMIAIGFEVDPQMEAEMGEFRE